MTIGSFISGYVPMFMLGSFRFALNVAVPQEVQRRTEYKWPAQDRMGMTQARQFTGMGDDTITLPGVIYPEWKGSTNAMAQLRALAATGQKQLLLDGMGTIYGNWAVTGVEETKSIFAAFAQPKKIEFTVTLAHIDGGDQTLANLNGTLLGTVINAASALL
jgi:phage protein U